MSDARRRAEEALVFMDAALLNEMPPLPTQVKALADAVRALLAEPAPACGSISTVRSDDLAALLAERPGHDRIGELEALLRECNAVCLCGCPDSEHETDECGESCGHDDHECIRVAPAVLEIVNRLRALLASEPEGKTEPKHTPENCTVGHGGALCDRCFSKVVNAAPSPARDEVRDAAERVAALAEHQTNQRGTPFVTLWGQEGVDAMSALRRVLAAISRPAAKGGDE